MGVFLHARTADFFHEFAGGQEGLVADHLGGQAEDRAASEPEVGGVFFTGRGRGRRRLLERCAQHQSPEHGLRVPAATDVVDGEGIE